MKVKPEMIDRPGYADTLGALEGQQTGSTETLVHQLVGYQENGEPAGVSGLFVCPVYPGHVWHK